MKDSQEDILAFWFEETSPQQWFLVNPDFDAEIRARFHAKYEKAKQGILDDWRKNADGCLALCILMDQFPRNMFRGTAEAFATDGKALVVAKYAVSKGFDQVLSPIKRQFVYMPYEHSENLNDQRKSVELFEKMLKDNPMGYEWAIKHLKVIEQYGRFPHRNKILGRENTAEEEQYLAQPGAGF